MCQNIFLPGREWEKVAAANIIQLEFLIPRPFLIRGSKDLPFREIYFAREVGRRLNISSGESRRERAVPGLIPRVLLSAS